MTDVVRAMYVSTATKFGNDYNMLPSQFCNCPPGYRGASCSIPLPQTCTAQNKLFDGNFGILATSPTKNFYCRVIQRNFGALLTLIHHRMKLTVHAGGDRVSFVIHNRVSTEPQASVPGVAENCSYMHDWINAELSNCTVQFTDIVAKTVKITCLNNDIRTCETRDDGRNPAVCAWFYDQYLKIIKPDKTSVAEFTVVNNTAGTGSGSISLPIGFGSFLLDFECDTGVCVDDLDFSNITVVQKFESLEEELPAIIGGTLGGIAGLLLVLGAIWLYMRRQPKKMLLDDENLVSSLTTEEKNLVDGIGLAWESISYSIKASVGKSTFARCLNTTQRQILNAQYGLVTPGQVCAILGPSGAGKTSLLNILADRRSKYEGQVHLVGRAVAGIARRDVISYVQQYDSLMATQTVREAIRFSAMLRIPNASKIRPQIEARINDLLARLKISHIADSVIGTHEKGGISGGERKRVDIGIELITNPALLLLDEPTSGLDSNNVDVLLQVLRNVADVEKCAILLTIHQVSGRDFMAFDSVLIMTNRGKTAYFGPPAKAVEHCKLSASPDAFGPLDNPAEVLLKEAVVVAGKDGEEKSSGNMMSNNWDRSPARTQLLEQIRTHLDSEERKAKRATVISLTDRPVRACPVQFYYLFQRGLRNLSRDLSLFLLTTFFSVAISVFVGLVFYQIDDRIPGLQNRFGLMFFLCIYFCLTSLSGLGKFVGNRTVFQREMDSGYYRVLPYYLSECLSDLVPLRVLPPIIFALILTPLVGLQDSPEKLQLLIGILVLNNLVAAAMCLMVSAGSSSIGQANYIAVLITIVSLIFGGLILSNDSTSDLSQIKVVSFIHYGYESLMANELHGKNYFFNPKVSFRLRKHTDSFFCLGLQRCVAVIAGRHLPCQLRHELRQPSAEPGLSGDLPCGLPLRGICVLDRHPWLHPPHVASPPLLGRGSFQ